MPGRTCGTAIRALNSGSRTHASWGWAPRARALAPFPVDPTTNTTPLARSGYGRRLDRARRTRNQSNGLFIGILLDNPVTAGA